jgi:two-component system KDP operon response regulator KdpE
MVEEKHKILIVDDEPQITRVLKTTSSNRGYATRTASDGDDAVQVIKE